LYIVLLNLTDFLCGCCECDDVFKIDLYIMELSSLDDEKEYVVEVEEKEDDLVGEHDISSSSCEVRMVASGAAQDARFPPSIVITDAVILVFIDPSTNAEADADNGGGASAACFVDIDDGESTGDCCKVLDVVNDNDSELDEDGWRATMADCCCCRRCLSSLYLLLVL
jgi:hypothetical protein